MTQNPKPPLTIAREQAVDFVNSQTMQGRYAGKKNTSSRIEKLKIRKMESFIGGTHRIQAFDEDRSIPLGWRLSNESSRELAELLSESSPNFIQKKMQVCSPKNVINDIL